MRLVCKKCKIEKHCGKFPFNRRNKSGFHSYCKNCVSELNKIGYRKRKEKVTLSVDAELDHNEDSTQP